MSLNQVPGSQTPVPSPVIAYATKTPPPMVAVIWCRLFALWMLVNGLDDGARVVGILAIHLFRLGSFRFFDDLIGEVLPVVLPAIVWLVMAWFCWRKAPSIANRMSEGLEPNASHPGITPSELLNILIIAIGVYLLTGGIPAVSQLIFLAIQNVRGPTVGMVVSQIIASVFSSIIRCALGFWLILGSRGVARLIQTHSGRWKDASAQPDPSSSDEINQV